MKFYGIKCTYKNKEYFLCEVQDNQLLDKLKNHHKTDCDFILLFSQSFISGIKPTLFLRSDKYSAKRLMAIIKKSDFLGDWHTYGKSLFRKGFFDPCLNTSKIDLEG
mgnify:CR=1 FL=1